MNRKREWWGMGRLQCVAAILLLVVGASAQAGHVFHVTGSGTEDNTAELQAAFDAAVSAGPGSVVMLAGQIYTSAVRVEGFHGTVRGSHRNPPTIDVLRGLDPTLPGMPLTVRQNGNLVPEPVIRFVDSTVRMRGPITFHITAADPSDTHLHGPNQVETTELANILRFGGTADVDIAGITMRGAPGSIDDFGGSWNVRVGIAFFTTEPFPFGQPTSGTVQVRNSEFDKLLIAFSSDSLVDAEVKLRRNTISDCAFCLIFSNGDGTTATYAHNRLSDVWGLGLFGLQISQPGVGPSVPISHSSTLRLLGNTIAMRAAAVAGLQVVDDSGLRFDAKTVDLSVIGNDISGGGFGASLAIGVRDYRVIGNHITGNWFVGIDAFAGSDNCTIMGNTLGRSRKTDQRGIGTQSGAVQMVNSGNCDVLLNHFVDVSGPAVRVAPGSRWNRIRFNNYRRSGIDECAIVLEGDNNVVTEFAFPRGTNASGQVCDTGMGNVVH